jgi:hypothetical protein
MNQEIIRLLKAAVECSVFLNPTDPGLSYQEILEVGKRSGFLDGEVADAARHAGEPSHNTRRIIPDRQTRQSWVVLFHEDPEYRNFAAFDFVFAQLNTRVRTDGVAKAQLMRELIVERALAAGISRNDIELAITYQIFTGQLAEQHGVLRFSHNSGVHELPSETLNSLARVHRAPDRKEFRARTHPIVKDIIERRTDGRAQSVEPLDAFSEQLDKLNYGAFRLWWKQTVLELRQGDPHSSPVSVCVLAAALVEGALTFVVNHARNLNLGVFRSSDFEREPKTWKIDDLVRSAASGSDSAILDQQTKTRAETLIYNRQRIHAGRMLADFPAGVPDIRPEEARDAKATADQVVRRILDWLQRYPPI